MRIFKYWTRIERHVTIGGASVLIHARGGSNHSIVDAERDAAERAARAASKMHGADLSGMEYESDILEEPLGQLDANNIITRNRYGAEVLNSTDHVFVDIDHPRLKFWDIFAQPSIEKKKARILEFLEKRAQEADMQGAAFRVYETHKGIRVLVLGKHLPAQEPATFQFMRGMHADGNYASLCRKQGCFRARLTPKPYRIKARTMKVRYPRDSQGDHEVARWVGQYNAASAGFATCKFLKTIGANTHIGANDAVIQYHDDRTGAFAHLALA